jgi:hypothetical protein
MTFQAPYSKQRDFQELFQAIKNKITFPGFPGDFPRTMT